MMSGKRYIIYTIFAVLVSTFGQAVPPGYAEKMETHMTGTFVGAGSHNAAGSVMLKGHALTLSDIKVDKVPDGRVYLTNDADYESGLELGKLTQFSGTVEYTIPAKVNPADYNSVLIWCKKFSVEIGHANLNVK